ncbi:MAG: molybdopterin molybdotransferase MoeA [Thermomicrobiales bacterium]|nr:molybdopterin molybdotransferase MoeA [Thermomicrobiales bacterium]
MVHPDEARALIFAELRRLPVEQAPLAQAAWRVLGDDVIASEDHPPFAASTMDGYAVVAEDPSPWREIVGHQTAGHVAPIEVHVGTASWVTTGAPLPPGANAVVPVEATELAEDHVVIHADDVKPGDYVRQVGVDIARGSVVLERGTTIGPAEIGLLAGLGIDPAPVSQRPRVGILSTGDELVDPWETPGPGQIRDSNRFSLEAAVQEAGGDVVWAGRGADDMWTLRQSLARLIAECDVVLTSGGVSMGDLDLVKPLLLELATVHFRRVFMKPGKPLTFATAGDTIVVGFPGNPVSAIVGFEVFLRPALRWMQGCREIDRPRLRVALAAGARPSDRIEMQRGVVSVHDGELIARTTGSQASSRLSSLVGSNALLVIPAGNEPVKPGTLVEAIMTGPIVAG